MIPAEITIPVAFCELYEMYVSPYTTSERYAQITQALSNGGAVERPVVRSAAGGKFQVLKGWDTVYECKQRGIDKIVVLHADYSDADAIYFAVIEQAKSLNLNWICVARALHKIKTTLNWKDSEIALACRGAYDRTAVSRLIKISKNLSPRLQAMAESGRICRSSCKRLITLPITKQEAIANEAIEKSLSDEQIMARAFPRVKKAQSTQVSTNEPKSHDIKVAEETLSLIIGSPIEISGQNNLVSGGTINCQFFNRSQLVGLINLILKNMKPGAVPAGRFTLSFKNLDEFDLLVGKHLDKEE